MSRSGARNTRHLRPFDSLLPPPATLGESGSVALPCSGVVGVERGGASGLATDEESSAAVRSSRAAPSVTATCVRISEIYLMTDCVDCVCTARVQPSVTSTTAGATGSTRGTHPYRHISAESADGSTDLYHVSVLTCAAADRVSTQLDWAGLCASPQCCMLRCAAWASLSRYGDAR